MHTGDPDPGSWPTAIAGVPSGTPVVMLNLLGFREVAGYDGHTGDCSGREAHVGRYGPAAPVDSRLVVTVPAE